MQKEIKLIPMILTLLIAIGNIVLSVFCVVPFCGQDTERDFDGSFIKSIKYQSLYEDSFFHIETDDYKFYLGTRLEILNLRKFLYRRVCDEYGRPERFVFCRQYHDDNNDTFTAKYRIEGKNTILYWDYGRMKKDFSKREVGVDEPIYWLSIAITHRTIKKNNTDD